VVLNESWHAKLGRRVGLGGVCPVVNPNSPTKIKNAEKKVLFFIFVFVGLEPIQQSSVAV
jgi:hypothetical protein